MKKFLAAILGALLFATGCGQKGPLVLPPKPNAPSAQPAPPSHDVPATTEQKK